MGAMASTTFLSCQNSEEPIQINNSYSEKDVEYSISVNVPDEMRTRGASIATIGESGLYEFPQRTINKLWYAVYYDGALKTNSTVTRNDNQPFSVKYTMSGTSDPSKLYFFLWAGNSDDKITDNFSSFPSSNIMAINYSSKYVLINPEEFHNNANFQFFDSFAGYVPFSDTFDVESRSKSIILTRPFAQITVLTDDFKDTDLAQEYPNGIHVLSAFGNEKITEDNVNQQLLFPNQWYFASDTYGYLETSKLYAGSQGYGYKYLFDFVNKLDGQNPSSVLFKDRKMDYLTCFFTVAPTKQSNFSKSEVILDKLNLTVDTKNFGASTSPYLSSKTMKYVSIDMPEEGIMANTRYIIYNKKRSEGGTGFLDGIYNYEILVSNDGNWKDPDLERESDRL